jgi:hypothetical protein
MNILDHSKISFKLSKQINELKKCNNDIEKIFDELEGISFQSSSDDSYDSVQSNHQYHHHQHHLINIDCSGTSLSDSIESDFSSDDESVNNVIIRKKNVKNSGKRSARISFRYKWPYIASESNPDIANESRFNKTSDILQPVLSSNDGKHIKHQVKSKNYRSYSVDSRPVFKNKEAKNFIKTPKLKSESKLQLSRFSRKNLSVKTTEAYHVPKSSSPQFRNRHSLVAERSSNTNLYKTNPISIPWKPNGKFKPDSNIYNSQTKINSSIELPKNKDKESKKQSKYIAHDAKFEPMKFGKPDQKFISTDPIKQPERPKEIKVIKDSGKVWKHTGTGIKIQNKYLLDSQIFCKSSLNKEKETKTESKKTASKVTSNIWKPALSKSYAFPNTWIPNVVKKETNIKQKPILLKKPNKPQKINEKVEKDYQTSTPKDTTPNMMDEKIPKLNESVIEKKNNDQTNLSNETFQNLELENSFTKINVSHSKNDEEKSLKSHKELEISKQKNSDVNKTDLSLNQLEKKIDPASLDETMHESEKEISAQKETSIDSLTQQNDHKNEIINNKQKFEKQKAIDSTVQSNSDDLKKIEENKDEDDDDDEDEDEDERQIWNIPDDNTDE